jgi:hypothetical protein
MPPSRDMSVHTNAQVEEGMPPFRDMSQVKRGCCDRKDKEETEKGIKKKGGESRSYMGCCYDEGISVLNRIECVLMDNKETRRVVHDNFCRRVFDKYTSFLRGV